MRCTSARSPRPATGKPRPAQLAELARLGVTLVEVMPIADWPGNFGWGYDGVSMFAPTRLYGTPDEFRAFVDEAHRVGLGVLLDLVYNHFGNHGCTVQHFQPRLLQRHVMTMNGGRRSISTARHAAGPRVLRGECPLLDPRISPGRLSDGRDPGDPRRLPRTYPVGRGQAARREAAGERAILMIGESEPQDTRLVRPVANGGFGLEALWNEDFHHAAMVRLGSRNEAYYTDYLGSADEFIALLKWGFLYQGQRYSWQNGRRGTPAFDLRPGEVRPLHSKPRSGRQHGHRQAGRSADQSRTVAGDDRSAAADAGDAAAVSRAGIRRFDSRFAFSWTCPRSSIEQDERGTEEIPGAVSVAGAAGNAWPGCRIRPIRPHFGAAS